MRPRLIGRLALASLVGTVALFPVTGSVFAQVATGEIYGKVTDASGAVLPGVAVSLASPALLQPVTAVTAETGTYRFPLLPIGVYTLGFELAGFRTRIEDPIRVEIGLNVQVNATLLVAGFQDVETVTAASPLIDFKDAGKNNRFTREALQAIPSARDPWVIIEQSAGVAMDKQNVGGSTSGQQSMTAARGTFGDSKWILDGVDITDMSTNGGSPIYYDFDAFEEMQVTTGGADVAMQTAGLAINLVTKSGTDTVRGSGRFYVTDDAFESNNVTDELRVQGVNTGNPIQNIRDYGLEAGGPLVKGRAWIWGGYGTQRIEVGINNFYKPGDRCQAMKAALANDPLAYSIEDTRTCLNPDRTLLENYNLKVAFQATRSDQVSFFFNAADKIKDAREASDLRPPETTLRQGGVNRRELGSRWWTTGSPKTYRWADRHVFSDRLLVEAQYAHVGNNFTLTFHDESLRSVQPAYEITTAAWSRSYGESVNVRPADSVDLTGTFFLPGALGGDHALKFGTRYRTDRSYADSMWGGDAQARFRNGLPAEAQLWRRAEVDARLQNWSLYAQDSFTRGRLTLNAGFRFDHQDDRMAPAEVPSSPFYGQPTFAGVYGAGGYSGQPFNQLPARSFAGFDPDVAFDTVSPRVGVTLDVAGRAVLKFYYARYVGQLSGSSAPGIGSLALVYNTVVPTFVRYPWVDTNGDRFVQANEIVLTPQPLSWTSGYDYRNPDSVTTSGEVDPALSVDDSHEVVVSVERQLMPDFAIGASYIWRRYENFRWNDRTDWTSVDYVPVSYQPTGCPPGARCDAVTYYEPVRPVPVSYVFTNWPDYWRGYRGFEVTARRRFSNGWQMNAGFSYNDARVHYDSAEAYEDPTNIENLDEGQFAPESISTGVGSVFVNAAWIFRVSGSWLTPFWRINLAGFYNSRSGYPFNANVQTPSRRNGAGIANVYLDTLGDNRLDTYQALDLRVDRAFTLGRVKFTPAMDVFNLLNANTPLSVRPVQNAPNANQVSSIVPPRVMRFGVRAEW